LTKVRSAICTIVALAVPLIWASPAVAEEQPRVTIAVVPGDTSVDELVATVPSISPGLLSAGLGYVPATQTYLDIGQGNRLFGSLYPETLPPLYVRSDGVPADNWDEQLQRAADAPADIQPGLLAGELERNGIPIATVGDSGSAALIAADPEGRVERASGCRAGDCPGVGVSFVGLGALPALVEGLEGEDMLIVIERPPPTRRVLTVGIAGAGFSGNLSSETTRLDGYVLSTDLAPTVLDRYGVEIPDAVSGRPIESTGTQDVDALADLQSRMIEVVPRRSPVIATNLIAWAILSLLAALFFGARGGRLGLTLIAVSLALVPGLLILTPALDPSETAERLAIGIGAPGLAALAWLALRGRFGARAGFAAFAAAALFTVAVVAVDVVAGSHLTARSLLGPNPGLGVRFFGIGNELEAVIAALLMLGSGAAIAALRPADPARAVTICTAVAVLCAVVVFARGRFGADVGAAITFPAGAAGVAIAAHGLGRRRILLLAAAPVIALAALVAVDLVIGGDAHLSRSVLDAGGLSELGEVFERRIRLGAGSFERFAGSPFFIAALVALAAAVAFRHRIGAWLEAFPAARAGFWGGVAATVVGTLANDSGALLLMVGIAYLAAFTGLCWAASHFTSDSDSGYG
jgi:hypothetical protein